MSLANIFSPVGTVFIFLLMSFMDLLFTIEIIIDLKLVVCCDVGIRVYFLCGYLIDAAPFMEDWSFPTALHCKMLTS